MNKYLLIFLLGIGAKAGIAQSIDSLYFNLYTDSLKKGTLNYINVDGKYKNGKILPLDETLLDYTSTAGTFHKNCLEIPSNFKEDKVTITVRLKNGKRIENSVTLYIKKLGDHEILKTNEEILAEMQKGSKKPKKNRIP